MGELQLLCLIALQYQDAGRKRKAPDSTCDAAVVVGAAQAEAAPLPPAPVAPGMPSALPV